MNIGIINGPNLNLLGTREPDKYGNQTLANIIDSLKNIIGTKGQIVDFQSNSESEIIDFIHREQLDGWIINAAAFTHTSIAIRDALLAVKANFIEVHISNVYKREEFRHKSYLSDIAVGVICGLGPQVYSLALNYFLENNK